jgi:D-xylonolactonase
LRILYATTAAKGLDAEALAQQPEAGNVFSFRAEVAGQPVTPVAL